MPRGVFLFPEGALLFLRSPTSLVLALLAQGEEFRKQFHPGGFSRLDLVQTVHRTKGRFPLRPWRKRVSRFRSAASRCGTPPVEIDEDSVHDLFWLAQKGAVGRRTESFFSLSR